MKKIILLIRTPFYIFFIFMFILLGCKNSNPKEKTYEEKIISKNLPWSTRLAQSFVQRHPGSVTYDEYMVSKNWGYEQGVILEAMRQMYELTADEQYYDFIKQNMEQYIESDGSIKTYNYESFNIDNIAPGRSLLFLYGKTHEKKYKIASDLLRKQLLNQPRTLEGGFWHKKKYRYQMWLDGLYMAQPFYAQYSRMFNEPENFNDIFFQFEAVYNHTYDKDSKLLYHGWNENKKEKWADKETGRSPHFWGRAIGWYLMAIVDVLDFIKDEDNRRDRLIKILNRICGALLKHRDSETGLWYQIIDLPERNGNYLEASCAAMFTYIFAKGVNQGYLDKKYLKISEHSFNSIIKVHSKVDEKGYIDLYNTCRSAGLGGAPYRDGSFEYYMSEPKRTNDFKGYGPLLFAAIELEKTGLLNK